MRGTGAARRRFKHGHGLRDCLLSIPFNILTADGEAGGVVGDCQFEASRWMGDFRGVQQELRDRAPLVQALNGGSMHQATCAYANRRADVRVAPPPCALCARTRP